ncbi:MAG: hypothetical protein ACLQIB_53945, partial [Isosphaeraceae bacterium]
QLAIARGGRTPDERIAFAFRRALARRPTAAELAVLRKGLDRYLAAFHSDRAPAGQLIHHGESEVDEKADAAELGAYAALAGVILNLDEAITLE